MNAVDQLIKNNGYLVKSSPNSFDLFVNDKKKESVTMNFFKRVSGYLRKTEDDKWVWKQ